ncbi:hypothetical protein R6Q57_020614 [Mikania cordata]
MENLLTPAMPPFWTDVLSNDNQSYRFSARLTQRPTLGLSNLFGPILCQANLDSWLGKSKRVASMTFDGDVAHVFRKPRNSYARDFILSLSELEIYKSLPIGFDQSILREFEENSIQERPKKNGNLQLQGFRLNDYASSPPTKGDLTNFSHGAMEDRTTLPLDGMIKMGIHNLICIYVCILSE